MTDAAKKLDSSSGNSILLGKSDVPQNLSLKYANRHGLVAGATGTGKTVTLQSLAESFSRAGVPVFAADIKGDLAGISQAGKPHPKIDERVKLLNLEDFTPRPCPTIFWDIYGQQGHPIRTTISEMGPNLISRLLELNDVQEGVLNICFSVADNQGLLLLDLKDLKELLSHVAENAKQYSSEYGNISPTTIATIQRKFLVLEQAGANNFFGEPALEIREFLRTTTNGEGYINLLAADKLVQSPRLYSTFLLWLLSELFEELPEVGDLDKPKLVFFFDEAHLLFTDAPKPLLEKIEQVVRLIRSKGVGVYFVTQSPQDIPENVLAQLSNRVQHALRAFTPKEQKAVKIAAQTFRPNPKFKTEDAITNLAIGEALVSTLESGGTPSITERSFIKPPESQIGAITSSERQIIINNSPLLGVYDKMVDRESAFEMLNRRKQQKTQQVEIQQEKTTITRKSNRMGYGETLTKQVIRTVGSQIGRQIVRGILGNILK